MTDQRYEPIEIDGKWYVMDHRHPDKEPAIRKDAEDARISATIWNLVSAPTNL